MNQISAVVITYNEERNIQRCISSLHGIVDEIIVIDSFSTDKTPDICERNGVNFVQHPFADFATQKNFGNELAQFPFILSLDADEALSDTLKESILAWKKSGSQDVMQVNRLTNFCGKWIRHSGWYPDAKFRLFRKSKARWAGEKVHEYLEIDSNAQKGKLHGDLLHYSFYTIAQHLNTINKYSTLKAEINFEKGKTSSLIKIIFGPAFKFFEVYVIKAGFRDGWHGYVIAKNSAYSDFLKHSKLKQLSIDKRMSDRN